MSAFSEIMKAKDKELYGHYSGEWIELVDACKHNSRYVEPVRKLDTIFQDIQEEDLPIENLDVGTHIYRARIVDNDKLLSQIIESTEKELGPPPVGKIAAGRFNPPNIRVFYGALDKKTACYEIKPYLKQTIAIASFIVKRPKKIFDATKNVKHDISTFIKDANDHFKKPLRPNDNAVDYVPTQILADYLQNKYGIDGIIYSSSLQNSGRNIVLFRKKDYTPILYSDSSCDDLYALELDESQNIEYKYLDSQELNFERSPLRKYDNRPILV